MSRHRNVVRAPQSGPPEPPDPDETGMDPRDAATHTPPAALSQIPSMVMVSSSEAALLAEVRGAFAAKTVAIKTKVERLQTVAEQPECEPFRCLLCGNLPGQPAQCRSCIAQHRFNCNPRIQSALSARPAGVPMVAWRAAIGAMLARRPQRANGPAIASLVDQQLPGLRASLAAAFAALVDAPIPEATVPARAS